MNDAWPPVSHSVGSPGVANALVLFLGNPQLTAHHVSRLPVSAVGWFLFWESFVALCLFNCRLRAAWALGGCTCTHTRQVCICECVRFCWASSGCNPSEPGSICTQLIQTASNAVWALYDACGWGGAGFCHTMMVRDSPSLSPGNICLSAACVQVSLYEILVNDHRVTGCNTGAPLCD